MSRSYNQIYGKLVEDKTDILGHIAYALYKSDKIAYIKKQREENNDCAVSEDVLKAYHDTLCFDDVLERYKSDAERILLDFTHALFKDMAEDIERDVIFDYKKHLADIIDPIKPSKKRTQYFHGVAQSILGAIIFMMLAAGLLFLLSLSKQQYTFTIGGDGSVDVEQSSTIAVPDTSTVSPL